MWSPQLCLVGPLLLSLTLAPAVATGERRRPARSFNSSKHHQTSHVMEGSDLFSAWRHTHKYDGPPVNIWNSSGPSRSTSVAGLEEIGLGGPGSSQEAHEMPRSIANLVQYATPLDRFRCGDCVCINVSRNVTLVDCSYKTTRKSQHSVPHRLPASSQSLDLSQNHIRNLTSRDLSPYPSLLALNISNNYITSIDLHQGAEEIHDFRWPMVTLDISRNPIVTIADYSFSNFPDLKHLHSTDIRGGLQNITNFTFAGLGKLEVLDLSYGIIHRIDSGAFVSLKSLRVLRLTRITGWSYTKMSPQLFLPLENLSVLNMAGSSSGNSIPSQVLNVLPKLKELYIDGNRKTKFGPEVRSLSFLDTVHLGEDGFCSLTHIDKNLFENLVHLKRLVIYDCKFKTMQSSDFGSLTQLEGLVLHKPSTLQIRQALNILPSLSNTTLKSLTFTKFYDRGGFSSVVIGHNESRFFQGHTSLEILKLEYLHLTFVDPAFVTNLPQSLRYLSLKGNRLHLVNLVASICLSRRLPHLAEFDLSDQNNQYKQQRHLSDQQKKTDFPLSLISERSSALRMWLQIHAYDSLIAQLRPGAFLVRSARSSHKFPNTSGICLPIFQANNAFRLGIGLLYSDKDYIKEIYFSNAYLNDWGRRQIPSSVAVADLSDNKCEDITMGFLRLGNQMEVMNLRGNYLGNAIARDDVGKIFARAKNVSYLDLSHNSITHIPYKLFRNMKSTQVLLLADNLLRSLDFKLSHMTSLKFLDVRRNSVSWISRRSRNDLDELAMSHEVTLGLEENSLQCSCGGLEFLSWLAFTRVTILDRDMLRCIDKDQQLVYMGDSEARFRMLRRTCVPNAYITAVSASCLAVAMVIMAFALVFRNRWRLYYWRNVILAKYYGMRHLDENNVDFKFDAYLVYSDETEEFALDECYTQLTERGHKVCLDAKDFLPGSFIPCNIVSAVQSSTFTVPILSAGYRDNEWFEYSLQMALMESAQSGRQVFHLVLYEAIQDEELSPDVLRLMKQNAFSELPPPDCPPHVRKVFWDALSRTIGHTANQEPFPRLELEP